ncbi:hypothetical protein [uncultured Thomasclavelia sp.]|uniref:rhodanese-like domain-containing protein n=1 Tax=uncultured Thomasclavelia sp. TaxID=3025759 RepID=UPI0025EC0AAC|nr:hypothetical protein [uncultured Thomasclavelia sp.]
MNIGGMEPGQALEYMKNNPDLVLIECTEPEWKLNQNFDGSLYIPFTLMDERFNQIPASKKIILYSEDGNTSKRGYEWLKNKKMDIEELSYIDGIPKIYEYNNWKRHH